MDIQEIRQQHDEGADRNALSYWSHNEMEVVLARVRELEAVLTKVSEVQWVNDRNGDMRCALCDHYLDKERHTDDCPFMAARVALAGES